MVSEKDRSDFIHLYLHSYKCFFSSAMTSFIIYLLFFFCTEQISIEKVFNKAFVHNLDLHYLSGIVS